jgi:hypothetical protein
MSHNWVTLEVEADHFWEVFEEWEKKFLLVGVDMVFTNVKGG